MISIDCPENFYEISEEDMDKLKDRMHSKVYYVMFGKKNGEKRGLLCTLSEFLVSELTNNSVVLHGEGYSGEMTDSQRRRKEIDRERGYVNVFDIGMKDFRKINRNKIYVINEVCSDGVGINKINELVEEYGVKTLANEHLFSKPKQPRTPSSPKQTVSKDEKYRAIMAMLGEDVAPVSEKDATPSIVDEDGVGSASEDELDDVFKL